MGDLKAGRDLDTPPGMRGANHSAMRERNERLVLSLVRRCGPMAKSDIARRTGLSAQTVSVIMRRLEEDGLLIKGDPVRGRVGQPSVPMDLAPDGAYFLGLKVGRRRTEAVMIDFKGTVLGSRVTRHDYPEPGRTLTFAREATEALTGGLSAGQRQRVAGFGIGLPFQLWDWAATLGVAPEAMAEWRHRDIRAELADEMEWPVFLENDATAACNAELVFGTAALPQNFLYAFVGFFIGGGLVLNGSLFAGQSGNAGALASVPVPGAEGPRQLLAAASLSQLEARIGPQGAALWENVDGWNVAPALLDDWVRQAAGGLAHALTAAVALCDLEALVIDGWLPGALRQRLLKATDAALNEMNLAGIRRPQVLSGTVGPQARSLGAASLPLSARFDLDGLPSA